MSAYTERIRGLSPSARRALARHLDEAGASGPRDPVIVAYVVPEGNARLQEDALRARIRTTLPDVCVPSHVVTLSSLPRTDNGKVNRKALPAPEPLSLVGRLDPPRSEVELTLADIWQDLLGREEIGRRDDFFELGGHSLMALRLAGHIEERFGRRIPIAEVFRHSTLEALAAWLEGGSGRSNAWSPLVPIQVAGGQPALICAHCIKGRIHHYYGLASALGDEQPVFALQPPGMDGSERPPDSVEGLARRYVSELRAANLKGPLRLCGFSFGGLIAFELAKQLTATGQKVESVTLFDSVLRPNESLLERLARHRASIQQLSPTEQARYAWQRVTGNATSLGRSVATRLVGGGDGGTGTAPEDAEPGLPPHEIEVRRVLERAERLYRPGPWPGRVVLIRQGDDEWTNIGWSRVARDLCIERIPGTHGSLLREPHLVETTRLVRQHFSNAGQRGGRG